MDGDDPWDWSVDRVVQELCTNNRSWRPHSMSMVPPPPEPLETALRMNAVSGSVLLIYVTESLMRENLDLAALGHRAFVQNGITELRSKSAQYQAHISEAHSTSLRSTVGSLSQNGFVPSTSQQGNGNAPLLAQLQSPQPRAQLTAGQIAAFTQLGAYGPLPQQLPLLCASSSTANDNGSRSPQAEYTVDGHNGHKRRKLDLIDANCHIETDGVGDQEDGHTFSLPAKSAEIGILTPAPEPVSESGVDGNRKKRKRIAPTLVTAELDQTRDRSIPTQADSVVRHDPTNVEPGVPFRGDDGRKRLVPVHLSDSESSEPYVYGDQNPMTADRERRSSVEIHRESPISTKHSATSDKHACLARDYLGKGKLAVDQVFYGNTLIGEELSEGADGKEFSEVGHEISSGRRLYMHRLMKHFLCTQPCVLKKNGKSFTAVLPYASRLALKHKSPSFTLYSRSSNQAVHATREELRAWPELDPEASSQALEHIDDEKHITFNPVGPEMLSGLDSYADWDPDFLDKYRYIKGGDEVLPLYGQSDEENEYDEETWLEMEEERGTLEKPLRALKRPPLSVEEVKKLIDECRSEMVLNWKETKLPVRQYRAFKLWRKFAITKKARVKTIRGDIKHLDDRIAKMREEIATEIWTSQLQVRKQCRIMELSIFDREDLGWEMSILRSNKAPERVHRPAVTKEKKTPAQCDDGEEGESLDSEAECLSSDDDALESFIIADDEHSAKEERELNLADGEDDEDDLSSEISFADVDGDSEIRIDDRKSKHTESRISSAKHQTAISNINRFESDLESPQIPPGLASVKAELELPKLPAPMSRSLPEMIDLTMLSSDDGPQIVVLDTPEKRRPREKLTHRSRPPTTPRKTPKQTETPLLDENNQPSYNNPSAIAQYPITTWETLQDRDRLLISVVHSMNDMARAIVFSCVAESRTRKLWAKISKALKIISGATPRGMDPETYENMARIARLFEIYIDCKYYAWRESPSPNAVAKLVDARPVWFEAFHELTRKLESFFEGQAIERRGAPAVPADKALIENAPAEETPDEDDEEDEGPQSAVRRQGRLSSGSDEDLTLENTPHKKRKKMIFEDVEAKDLRERDRQRQAELEARRTRLQEELAKRPAGMVNSAKIIINETKLAEHGFIHVNDHIARRIKKHQIEGVRFLWNQIVTDQETMQGCLLAHTMGLGKTMQVITLLVALAEAARSIDNSISSQIPESLKVSRTLVLCPPGLIDNWMDELLTWAPEYLLGDFRKVDSSVQIPQRLHTIDDWRKDGGVLVIGYEMFRQFVNNKKSKNGVAALTEEQHEAVCTALVDGPNIIIADEAHKMKNDTAALTIAASKFKSRSRIALTGSPLANNVAEYHTMIEWVAPNYLGPAVEFRAKYVEPIQEGLWVNSSPYERRKALKMLGVLKEDLAPKVNRADMSVLRDDLPPKKEFVITIPLTKLQIQAYTLYVRSMLSSPKEVTKDGHMHQTTLWHWLGVLSLLCNHPSCFNAKLNERKEDARKEVRAIEKLSSSRDPSDEEEAIAVDLNAPVWKSGVSLDLINSETELFNQQVGDLGSVELSYKTKILTQILDACKAAGDKVLVFSQSISTLDFLEKMCKNQGRVLARLDGSTKMSKRQSLTKAFNKGKTEVYLISTTAGGLGLNLPGANRVVIFDFKFNPIMEEQAVGRAYRIGQKKPVFVYRFVAGGTFEDDVHNKAVFKKQLSSRVVDKKNPVAWAKKALVDFLAEPKPVEQKDLSEFRGMDPKVLDVILRSQGEQSTIRAIVQSDTFERDDDERLTAEEQIEVTQLLKDEKLKRSDPKAWQLKQAQLQSHGPRMGAAKQGGTILPPGQPRPNQQSKQGSSLGVLVRPVVSPAIPSYLDQQKPPTVAGQRSPMINLEQSSRASLQPVAPSGKLLTAPPDSSTASPKDRVAFWIDETTSAPASVSTTQSPLKELTQELGAVADPHKNQSSSILTQSSGDDIDTQMELWKRLDSALLKIAKASKPTSDVPRNEEWSTRSTRVREVNQAFRRHAPEASVLRKSVEAAAHALENGHTAGVEVLNARLSPGAFAQMFIGEVKFRQHGVGIDNGKVRDFHGSSPPSVSDIGSSLEDLRKDQMVSQTGGAGNGHLKRSSSETGPANVSGKREFRQPSKAVNFWRPQELQAFLNHHDLDNNGPRDQLIARCMAKTHELWQQEREKLQAPVTQPTEQDGMAGIVKNATDAPVDQNTVVVSGTIGIPASPVSTASNPPTLRGDSILQRAYQSIGFGR